MNEITSFSYSTTSFDSLYELTIKVCLLSMAKEASDFLMSSFAASWLALIFLRNSVLTFLVK